MPVHRRLMSAVLGPLMLVTAVASAEPAAVDCTGQDATACGRLHFEAGTAAFEQNDFRGAEVEFRAAIEQRAHPVIRFNLALSLAKLGQPSAALEQLSLVIADSETDKDLRGRAERERNGVDAARARVSFRLSDPSRERVELDGKPLDLKGQRELPIDPGTHHVRVISGSAVVLDQELELSPGERVELRVGERSRRIDVVVVPPDGSEPAKPNRPAAEPPSRPLAPVWFYAAAGATVVVTGVTIWSGLDTRSALTDYERDLPSLSQAQADERVADGHSRELRTNLLLTGSIVAGVGTTVLGLWFVDFGGGARARAALTPSSLVVSGTF